MSHAAMGWAAGFFAPETGAGTSTRRPRPSVPGCPSAVRAARPAQFRRCTA